MSDPFGSGIDVSDFSPEELRTLQGALARQIAALDVLKRWPGADGDLDIGGGVRLYQAAMALYEEGWKAGRDA